MNQENMIEATLLGKRTEYPQHYKPDILVAVPRQLNREQYGIQADSLPFVGFDTWHAYELSALTDNGLPVTALLKLVYPADSHAIVESKSLKLYLNSFNMERMGSTPAEVLRRLQTTITCDLSTILQTTVAAHIFTRLATTPDEFADYTLLEDTAAANRLVISHYTETPSLLSAQPSGGELHVASHLLRSNCKITHQPDWGSLFLRMKGPQLPTFDSLLAYIVSIRNENHFHEEICEMIFMRLLQRFQPKELMTCCIYTRRGGIDICPSRATSIDLLPQSLCRADMLTPKLLRQ